MAELISQFFIDPKDLPETVYGFVQVATLGVVYGFILFNASNLISNGSELLLLVPSLAGIVGCVVLPVLGAVPDGAIVLFSGMGENAQEQVSVGVGALAGSTIMLLTLPWALSVIAGRVDIDKDGNGNYRRPRGNKKWKKLNTEFGLRTSGVVVGPEISTNGKMMMLTSLIYLVIQLPALKRTGTTALDAVADTKQVTLDERVFAYIGFGLCLVSFLGYLGWNVQRSSQIKEDTVEEHRIKAIRTGEMSLSGIMCDEFIRMQGKADGSYGAIVNVTDDDLTRLEHVLKPFFKKYDANRDNRMDRHEIRMFFSDLNEKISNVDLDRWFVEADQDQSGYIEFSELVHAVAKFLTQKSHMVTSPFNETVEKAKQRGFSVDNTPQAESYELDDDDEEEEDIPHDLTHLSFEEQQRRIKIRSLYMMSIGTMVVLIFSDPMVDVLSEVGKRTGIPSFYISFVVAPLASNASELIASFNYAKKKTSKTISISIATLLGAACMNNTFCLGIFMALIAFKGDIVWEFSAETISILVVQMVMGVLAMKRTQRLLDAFIVLAIFPASILLVFVLQNVFGLD